jgi:hypothetical protein
MWTLFTKDFSKLRLVLLSAGSLALFCIALNAGLMPLSSWAEVRYNLYPFREEDYLRYLLPSMYEGRGHNRLLLAGPSEAREGLLEQAFDRELGGMHAFNAAQSLGTLDDLLVGLEYIEKVYGNDAKPKILVVGITPRFVANIRSADEESPLVKAINRYSPYYRVEETAVAGSYLVPKNKWEGMRGWALFLHKQPVRYRPALGGLLYETYSRYLKGNALADRLAPILERDLAVSTSPHRERDGGPWSPDQLQAALAARRHFWAKTSEWDPSEDATRLQAQLTRLKQLATNWGTQLYVVNLPEHPMTRQTYERGRYQKYLTLTREALGDTPFLNLRELLNSEEFYDLAHPTLEGAQRETDLVVKFVMESRGGVAQRAAVR